MCWRSRSRGRKQVNPAINAIVHKQYDKARKAAAAGPPQGPLAGVPYLIKDLAFLETGEPARLGSSLFKDFVADHDSAYVARCKKAGLVIFGRTLDAGVRPQPQHRAAPQRRRAAIRGTWSIRPAAHRAAPRRR